MFHLIQQGEAEQGVAAGASHDLPVCHIFPRRLYRTAIATQRVGVPVDAVEVEQCGGSEISP